jgi:hypothetical protein
MSSDFPQTGTIANGIEASRIIPAEYNSYAVVYMAKNKNTGLNRAHERSRGKRKIDYESNP